MYISVYSKIMFLHETSSDIVSEQNVTSGKHFNQFNSFMKLWICSTKCLFVIQEVENVSGRHRQNKYPWWEKSHVHFNGMNKWKFWYLHKTFRVKQHRWEMRAGMKREICKKAEMHQIGGFRYWLWDGIMNREIHQTNNWDF